MDYIIFVISVIGIWCICFVMENYWFLNYEKEERNKVQIILTKDNVDYDDKKEFIEKVMCGNYENIMDIVDNMRIN